VKGIETPEPCRTLGSRLLLIAYSASNSEAVMIDEDPRLHGCFADDGR
jgi:hypothetical protein